eukprot:CAMPEP_0206142152 /NCGR_PEP_ID=MMETSP1473-20131121/15814_1 /ASSEMBLY_ACC=CAM_ASM_001109 /TAXON_ID=1461547 /ORGANISM="Stichococcus sp, Strain RCC1054" /LENGTH=34 /DNA_ID= /DNA_START= /DNA_END= /DNA_ORIENTATION=
MAAGPPAGDEWQQILVAYAADDGSWAVDAARQRW